MITDLQEQRGKILSLLGKIEQPQIASEIGEELGISTKNVETVLLSLFQRGIVSRETQFVDYLNRDEFHYRRIDQTEEGATDAQKRRSLIRDLLVWDAPNAYCQRQVAQYLGITRKLAQSDLKCLYDDENYPVNRENRVDKETQMECYFYWWEGKTEIPLEIVDEKSEIPPTKLESSEGKILLQKSTPSLRELVEEWDVELPSEFLELFNSGQLETIRAFLLSRKTEIASKKNLIG